MRVAALWVPDFPLQALWRSMPELAETPLAVAAGPAPRDRLVAVSAEAAELGVRVGMTAAQARQKSMQVMVRVTPPEVVAAAEAAFGDAARAVSPRVRRHAPGEVLLDVGGSVLRWGGEPALAEALWRACRRVGLDVRVGLAGSIGVARIAARVLPPAHPGERREANSCPVERQEPDPGSGIRGPALSSQPAGRAASLRPSTFDLRPVGWAEDSQPAGWAVVPTGGERAFLAPRPVHLLELSPVVAGALGRWGIGTIGALAELPRSELILRLGPEGEALHRLACGDDGRAFIPDRPVVSVREGACFDDAIGALEPFLFVLNGVLGRLARRLELRGEGFSEVRLELALEGGERYQTVVRLVAPTREVTAVLPLVRLRLEASPPGAPVEGVSVVVQPGTVRLLQGHLFGPPSPSPGKLAAALVRLAALVGPDRVGAPAVADTHEPGRYVVLPFAPSAWEGPRTARPVEGRRSKVEGLPPTRPVESPPPARPVEGRMSKVEGLPPARPVESQEPRAFPHAPHTALPAAHPPSPLHPRGPGPGPGPGLGPGLGPGPGPGPGLGPGPGPGLGLGGCCCPPSTRPRGEGEATTNNQQPTTTTARPVEGRRSKVEGRGKLRAKSQELRAWGGRGNQQPTTSNQQPTASSFSHRLGAVVRAVRPPLPAHVVVAGRRPVAVQVGRLGGTVVALAGPYRTTGNWWGERPFSRDDYDVALADGSLLRLSFDRLAKTWAVDGVYD